MTEGEAVAEGVSVAVAEAVADGVAVSPVWCTVIVILALRGLNLSDARMVCRPVFQLWSIANVTVKEPSIPAETELLAEGSLSVWMEDIAKAGKE